MGTIEKFIRSLFKRSNTNIPQEHFRNVDPLYAAINIEDVGVYKRYFDNIIAHVDVDNYTKWSMSRDYDRNQLQKDDAWMYQILLEADRDGIKGALLQNMVNQYFFADILERHLDKPRWVRRVMHPDPERNYFPDGRTMRLIMERVSG